MITRTVWILSLVSLFTDAASEMLYPVMPLYLKGIGFSILLIGILEGLAEAVAGLSKGYFGKLSDSMARRLPFVQWGYFLSSVSKPMMAAFVWPLWVFFSRSVDRIGKGIRTGARDALLSDEATPETKGSVFGFHRSMDTVGAVIGPLLALLYLNFYPGQYRMMFLLAFIPGFIAVMASLFLKEKKRPRPAERKRVSYFSFFSYWKMSTPQYRRLMIGLLLFALFNSSDVFLLLKARQSGLADDEVIALYICYNIVYACFALPVGMIADKAGLKNVFLFGLLMFSVVYGGIAFTDDRHVIYLLFILYGIYAAATEGVSRAWISNTCRLEDTATAIGSYTGFQSVAALLSSSLAGFAWYRFGYQALFISTSVAVLLVMVYVALIPFGKPVNMMAER